MVLGPLGAASVVFLILYALLFFTLILGFSLGKLKLKSRWSFVLFHVTLRLAAQSVGLAFDIKGYAAVGLLVAYLVLGAEGYFSLVLCTGRFLVSFHNHRFGDSWLEPKQDQHASIFKRLGNAFNVRQSRTRNHDGDDDDLREADAQGRGGGASRRRRQRRAEQNGKFNPLAWVHQLLIAANVLIIVGSTLRNDDNGAVQSPADFRQPSTAVALRATGQAIFLVINLGLLGCVIATVLQVCEQDQRRATSVSAKDDQGKGFYGGGQGKVVKWFGHPYLLLLLATAPFLIARGVFGVCQSVVHSLNYYNAEIYTATGLAKDFVIKESILTIAMEWTTCSLLMLTWPVVDKYGYGKHEDEHVERHELVPSSASSR